ncbi:MAG TPA: hypothetical protein VF092_30950 [Longimicrobium sp.]
MHADLLPLPSPRAAAAPLRLVPAARNAQGPVQNLVLALRRCASISPRLRDALLQACAAPRPFRSVARLAAAAGCDRRTLWRDWRQAMGDSHPLRLEDVLHWLLLARAMEMRAPGRSWGELASAVAVHPQTLARFARQFTRRSLRGVSADPAAASAALERALIPFFADDIAGRANAA